jgi:NAD(P)-dependent dehydrogenase (short-subunit alcohol dehydrogenase family)
LCRYAAQKNNLQITRKENIKMENNLSGRSYVVTGATSGIGLATAEALVRQDAFVIGIGRSAERCQAAQARLLAINPQARVAYRVADLSLQSQVRGLRPAIQELLEAEGKGWLDGLVNNAGTFTYWLTLTPEGFETQWAVNHLAPFLLTQVLLPLLMAAPAARVVTVSSDSHFSGRLDWDDLQLRRHYNGLRAYENTKLANVMFTTEFNRLVGSHTAVRAFAADPGLVKTDIGLKGTPALVRWIWERRRAGGTPPEKPAEGIVYLLSEPSLQNSTEYYWKDCKARRPKPQALDSVLATRLWAQSSRMCGIE